jgi:hydroxymethylpyrimidine/phosphomethylpyrimidine kinase
MIAKSGAPLLREDAVDTLIRKLIPLATVITPNKPEAERLSGIKIGSLEDAKVVAKELVEGLGAKAAVVKGGHMSGGESVDILYYDGRFYEFRSPRIESRNTHGTGCSFSAAITAELAKGRSIPEAVKLAKEFITTAIMYGLPIGRGYGPVNPTAWQLIPAEKYNVLVELKNSVRVIEGSGKYVNPLIPETPSYIVMALPKHYVRDVNAVAGTPIVRLWGSVKAVVEPEFGICREFGELLMKVMEFNNDVRALMSIKYDERLVDVVSRLGFKTLRIGLREALRRGGLGMYGGELSKELDIIFDVGGWGLEPLTIVLGRNSLEVTEKVLKIGKEYSGGLKER